MSDSQTTTSRDATPDPAAVQGDVNAILNGAQARQRALPAQLQPGYRSTMPAPLQSPAPWAQPIQLQPQPTPPVTQQPPPVTPPVTQPAPQQQAVAQPPPLQPRPGEAPPLRNMPMLWNGNQVGPSGQTKQQFLLGRMMHESQGDPSVLNYVARNDPRMYDRGFTASGLLQDLNTTWARGVQWALADPAKYPMSTDPRQFSEARQAPWDVQWQVNSAIYDHAGETPWHADGGRGLREMRGIAGVRDAYQASYEQPAQTYAPATPRDFHSWGQSPEGQPGRQQDTPTIMERFAPLLVGIASLALRLPLSTAITAYGAMARAQQNGQQLEYERNRTKYQDALKEATAQQQLESRAASDAFETYGTNNPEGLQQELARIALQYNDPVMLRLAEQGDLNRIHQLQQRRDALNQNLQRTKELQELQDQEEVDRTVKADMAQWDKEHPDATPEERQIAEFETRTKRQNEMAGKRTGGAGAQGAETGIYDVLGADGKPTGRQVRLGKDGRYLDPNTGQPAQLQPGETVQERARERAAGAGEGMEGPVYDVIKDGKPTGRQVRAGKQGGLFDVSTNQPTQLQPGETVQQAPRQSAAPSAGEGMAVYDVIGADGKPTGRQVRMGKQGGLFDLNNPPQPVSLGEGETVRPVSRVTQPQPAYAGPETWQGAPYAAPPGVDEGLWRQAVTWAQEGRPPVGLGGRTSAMYQQVEPLVPAAMKALGIQSLADQQIKFEAQRHRLNSIETGFGSGVLGRNLVSLNTVADHISLFRQYAEALRNGDVQAINQLRNRLATETGSPEVIDFALAGRITGDEVVRLLTTTGGTLADREDIASRLASYNSPDQFEGAANTLTNYVRGRYAPLRQAFARGDPERERYFDQNMVTPEARRLFQGPQAPIPGQEQSGQWPTPPDEAIQQLKKDPGSRAHFDEIFGPGAAARVLGQ